MLDSSGPNRVETRRILVCPYCGRLQRAIISPAPFGIECMRCHRVFLVSHDGAVAIPAAALVDAWEREPSNTLS